MTREQKQCRVSGLDQGERRARACLCACRAFGDIRGVHECRDLASIQRARRALRARPAVQVQAAA